MHSQACVLANVRTTRSKSWYDTSRTYHEAVSHKKGLTKWQYHTKRTYQRAASHKTDFQNGSITQTCLTAPLSKASSSARCCVFSNKFSLRSNSPARVSARGIMACNGSPCSSLLVEVLAPVGAPASVELPVEFVSSTGSGVGAGVGCKERTF